MTLKAIQLAKRFPGVVALGGVDLELRSGSVHALVGANGAGKSTLIKILSGYYAQYEGQITLDGRPITLARPSDALAHGIEVVHQEVDTALVPSLSAAENLLIEQLAEGHGSPFFSWKDLYAQARQLTQRVGLQVDVAKRVEELSLHQKQLLLIARAVSRKARYLILDEPTASLSLPEVERLFATIAELKADGVAVIYISHRLGEVRAIADEITVLRNGRLAGQFPADTPNGPLIQAMLGTPADEAFPAKTPQTSGPLVLKVQQVSRRKALQQVSLEAYQGEILGIAGLVGAGKTELLRILFGADRLDAGSLELDGKPIQLRHPSQAVRRGIFLVPEERRSQGLHIENSVRENITLPFLQAFSWLSWVLNGRERSHAQAVIGQVGLRPPRIDLPVRNLSGGNQQKVVIGKWVGHKARVLLFDEATQGIDVQAKQEVYRLAREMSQQAAVIYAASDLDEVLGLADRIIVMRDGQIVATLDSASATRELLLEYATGARQAEESSDAE